MITLLTNEFYRIDFIDLIVKISFILSHEELLFFDLITILSALLFIY